VAQDAADGRGARYAAWMGEALPAAGEVLATVVTTARWI
jgi:hypothetical protein